MNYRLRERHRRRPSRFAGQARPPGDQLGHRSRPAGREGPGTASATPAYSPRLVRQSGLRPQDARRRRAVLVRPDKAKSLLDEAGWTDDDGDGCARRTASSSGSATSIARGDGHRDHRFITDWLNDVGIATDVDDQGRGHAHARAEQGRVRPVHVGLDAVRRPRSAAVVLHHASVPTDPDVGGYNDANWCNAGVRRALRAAEPGARPGQARRP